MKRGGRTIFHMAGICSPSPRPSPVKMSWGGKTMLARRRSQRRVRAPGLQGRGFFIPGGEPRFMATPVKMSLGTEKETGWKPVPPCRRKERSPQPTFHLWWSTQRMTTTVEMPSGGRIMLALTRSQRRVRAPGLQESGFIIPGGEPLVMATPSGRGRIVVRRRVIR